MITLTLLDKTAYVWDAKDWLKLREEYHIVGNLIGCLAHLPRQELFPGLPMALLPEETTLLIEQNAACLVQYSSLSSLPGRMKEEFDKYREDILKGQVVCFKEERKRSVTRMIDQIVEGKRRKLLGLGTKKKKTHGQQAESSTDQNTTTLADSLDKDTLLREEVAKITSVDENSTLIQTFTACPWLKPEDACPVQWHFPSTPKEKLRYKVFKDLREKGFYISHGHTFGGDFLLYPGDPVKFHAQFLVICVDRNLSIPTTEMVAYGRLGTSVRKTVVLASILDLENVIEYQSLQWSGPA